MSELSANEIEIRAQRLENARLLEELGYPSYGRRFDRDGTLAEITEAFEVDKRVRLAGRLVAKREMGKSIFAHLQDGSGRFQLYLKKDVVGDTAFAAFKKLDLGDIIGIEGSLFVTRSEEQTARVESFTLLTKSLLPLPEKWSGLQDVETRLRQRYLDLIANPEVLAVFEQRIAIVREMRRYLDARDFKEVETPMMQPLAGGAAATPFETWYNALSMPMFLRIAPELYLKRLLVGGFDKVYELNRNFRNEGLSRNHNPEFTMLEIYQAYGNVETMKDLVRGLICHVAETVIGSLHVGTEREPVNLENWRTVEYRDLIREAAGKDYYDLDLPARQARAKSLGCHVESDWNAVEVGQEIFEKCIERNLIDPTFVVRLPAELVPLARRCEDDESLVDVYELIIGGKEISPGYTELNDALDQRERFVSQLEDGDDGAGRVDFDFVEALEHGMPPAGGLGLGVDRLVMLLTGTESIRDVILFPQLKTKSKSEAGTESTSVSD